MPRPPQATRQRRRPTTPTAGTAARTLPFPCFEGPVDATGNHGELGCRIGSVVLARLRYLASAMHPPSHRRPRLRPQRAPARVCSARVRLTRSPASLRLRIQAPQQPPRASRLPHYVRGGAVSVGTQLLWPAGRHAVLKGCSSRSNVSLTRPRAEEGAGLVNARKKRPGTLLPDLHLRGTNARH
jgi:hypothetical protein